MVPVSTLASTRPYVADLGLASIVAMKSLAPGAPAQTNRYDDWAAAICGATSARMASTRMMFMAARVLRALAVVKVTPSRRPEGDRSRRRRARLTDRRTGTSPPSAGPQPPLTPAGSAPPAPVHRTAYQPPRALQCPVGAHEGGERDPQVRAPRSRSCRPARYGMST